jgi:sigma-B regulation protein RsbU (phosphoserine phosphatase)
VSSLLRLRAEHDERDRVAHSTRVARESAENALVVAQGDARQRDTYIGILGHDLRNPLTAILLGAEAVSTMTGDATIVQIARRITRSANRMTLMVRDLLDFARGELASGIPIHPEGVDLAEVASRVVEELRPLYPRREILLDCRGELAGRFDKDRMEQALSNLVGNALEHSDATVRISLAQDRDQVVAAVHNGGTPIPDATIARLFEPFRQRDGRHQGLGLGMFIVKKVVEAHGGLIEVTSTSAEGTTATMRLPLHRGEASLGA